MVLADGHGGWFGGGSFACVGAVHTPSLVRLGRDGHLDTSWRAQLPPDPTRGTGYPSVIALALAGNTLYAAGSFGVAAFDAESGVRLWLTATGGRGGVLALAANAKALFVGGDFGDIGGKRHPSLALLDPSTGRLLPWQGPALGRPGRSVTPVFALALSGDRLYVGGGFSTVGGKARPHIAALNARSGRLLPWIAGTVRGFTPGSGPDGAVDSILVADRQVFAAGDDTFGISDAPTGTVEQWTYTIDYEASSFGAYGRVVYLGGGVRYGFDGVAGKPRNNLAAVVLPSGRVTPWAPNIDRFVNVGSIAATQDRVLVAGGFSRKID